MLATGKAFVCAVIIGCENIAFGLTRESRLNCILYTSPLRTNTPFLIICGVATEGDKTVVLVCEPPTVRLPSRRLSFI